MPTRIVIVLLLLLLLLWIVVVVVVSVFKWILVDFLKWNGWVNMSCHICNFFFLCKCLHWIFPGLARHLLLHHVKKKKNPASRDMTAGSGSWLSWRRLDDLMRRVSGHSAGIRLRCRNIREYTTKCSFLYLFSRS